MAMHLLSPRYRLIAFVFPAIIVGLALYMFPIFSATGRPWWAVFILALCGVVAGLIFRDFWASAIGFDASGVHYRSVGYRIFTPWSGVHLQANGAKPILHVTQGERHFFPWLQLMYNILTVLQPYRAARASEMMTTIPLYAFTSDGTDSVMRDLRAAAPNNLV